MISLFHDFTFRSSHVLIILNIYINHVSSPEVWLTAIYLEHCFLDFVYNFPNSQFFYGHHSFYEERAIPPRVHISMVLICLFMKPMCTPLQGEQH